jgi:tetratricopeptide (TPR) repeat protein
LLRDRGVAPADASVLASRMAAPEIWPGVAVELLDALTRSGALVENAGGGWRAPDPRRISDDELPPPERVRKEVLSRLARLDAETRELVEVLAVFGRPVGAGLVARSVARPARVPMALDALVASGLLVAEPGNDDHALRFAWPGAGVVVRAAMGAETVAARHLAAAAALQRQRWRDPASIEVATHLAAGGKPDQAVPLFARAATASLSAGRPSEALRCADEGLALAAHLRQDTLPDEVHGELASGRAGALVALGRWPEARDALVRAVALASERGAVRCSLLAELGFVLHRVREWDEAERVLEEVLAGAPPGHVAHERAVRVLADVRLCRGDPSGAAAMLEAAVQRSEGAQQARVRRGLASVYVMQGALARSATELAAAEALVPQDAEPILRASVLARQIDLELAAGRMASALRRAEVLVDHARARGLVDRAAEALALLAWCRASVGQRAKAVRAAEEALEGMRDAERVRVFPAVRVLLNEGKQVPLAAFALRSDVHIDASLFDPYGQVLALRARALVATEPVLALEFVRQATSRPLARLVLARAFLAGDAASALIALGMPDRALAVLDALDPWPAATDGLQLDVLALRARAGDPGAAAKLDALAGELASHLDGGLRETFRQRWPSPGPR